MNEFTQEELKIILLEMMISINRHKGLLTVAPSYQALRDKVESMIDTYCEPECRHYWEAQPVTYKVETNPLTYNAAPLVIKCKHCGKIANE